MDTSVRLSRREWNFIKKQEGLLRKELDAAIANRDGYKAACDELRIGVQKDQEAFKAIVAVYDAVDNDQQFAYDLTGRYLEMVEQMLAIAKSRVRES